MVNPGTPEISADLVRTLLRSRGKISGATLTCAAAALLGCPEATDDEKVRFYMFLIKRLDHIAQDGECRANVQKLMRYPDELKVEDSRDAPVLAPEARAGPQGVGPPRRRPSDRIL